MGEYVTRAELDSILKSQQCIFESFLKSYMDSVSGRIDTVISQVTEVKCAVVGLEKKVDQLTERIDRIEKRDEQLVKDISHVDERLEEVSTKSDYLENQSRRNNLRFEGIPESPAESWDVTEAKVRQHLVTELGFTQPESAAFVIERAHRVGQPRLRPPPGTPSASPRSSFPRPIVAP